MCSLLGDLLKLGLVSRKPEAAAEAGGEFLQRGFLDILVSCCDLSQLPRTGLLSPKRGFLRVPNMHALVAPLIIRLGWERSKVRKRS